MIYKFYHIHKYIWYISCTMFIYIWYIYIYIYISYIFIYLWYDIYICTYDINYFSYIYIYHIFHKYIFIYIIFIFNYYYHFLVLFVFWITSIIIHWAMQRAMHRVPLASQVWKQHLRCINLWVQCGWWLMQFGGVRLVSSGFKVRRLMLLELFRCSLVLGL